MLRRRRLEAAERDGAGDADAQFLHQLPGQALQRRLALLVLAAGQHEAGYAVLAHGQDGAVLQDHGGGDADHLLAWGGHGATLRRVARLGQMGAGRASVMDPWSVPAGLSGDRWIAPHISVGACTPWSGCADASAPW